MRFAIEPFSAWYRDAMALFHAHWKLIGRHKERFRLAPDWQRWLEAEQKGLLFCATARLGWALSGYAIFLVTRHWDYPDMLEAKCRAIYIDREQLHGLKVVALRALHSVLRSRARGARREQGDPPRQARPRLSTAVEAVRLRRWGLEHGAPIHGAAEWARALS